jgi:type I restriction enzyme S subunit
MIKETTHKKKSSHQENPKNQGSDNMKQGWEIKTIGDVCVSASSNVSQNKLANDEGDYPIFGASGLIKKVSFYHRDQPYLSIVKDGSGVGRVTKMDAYTSIIGTLQYIIPKENIDLDYLNYSLMSVDFKKYVAGAAIPHIYFKDYKNEPFLWMPLPEQQRIVSILDECFAAIDKALANAEQNLLNAKELFESYLQGVFENGNWERKTIEDVCDEIFAGGDAPKNNYSIEPNEKHNIPIYANAVKDRGLYGYTDFSRVTKPCVTIAARGSGTGHTELRNEHFLPIVRLIVCIPDTNQMSTEFLKYTIDNLVIQRSGSAIPQLTIPMIKDYKIPAPSIEEQKQIIEKAETLRAETQKLEAVYQKKMADLGELKKSILQKAFAGELKTGKSRRDEIIIEDGNI